MAGLRSAARMCHGAAMARKTSGGWDEVEFEQQAKLAGEGEVEQDEGEGKDEADEALGEQVERGDGGEAEAGQQA